MKLKSIYASYKLVVSIELFPPKSPEQEQFFYNRIPTFKEMKTAFYSVTFGAAGFSRDRSIDISKRLKNEWEMETVSHLTCIGLSKDQLRSILADLKSSGIENIVAVRGDLPQDLVNWTPPADRFVHTSELVAEAVAMGFSVAVAGFPEKHPEAPSFESDLRYLKEKVDAGADAIITQLFLDNEDFYRYWDAVRKQGIKVPVIPGILPIRSVSQLHRFTKLCCSRIPAALTAKIQAFEHDNPGAYQFGIDYATEQCRGLMKRGVAGLHFYSVNHTDSTYSILKNLRQI